MTNINAHHKGHRVTTTKPMRFLAADFPGWGDPNYADYFVDLPAGQHGVISDVESHGSNPWTRYTILLDNNCRTSGVYPTDIRIHPKRRP